MSYYIQLGISLNDALGIKEVAILWNDTELKSDSELIKTIAFTIIKALKLNEEDVMIQDMLNDLDISKPKS